MAFSFDSLTAIGGALLFAAAALAWIFSKSLRSGARLNFRFGAVLFAALGVAGLIAAVAPVFSGIAWAVALLVTALGSTALALGVAAALSRPPPPLVVSLALGAGLAGGLAAALGAAPVVAVAVNAVAAFAIAGAGIARLTVSRMTGLEAIGGALAMLGGGLTVMALAEVENALGVLLLFFAAGLLGLACALRTRVEAQGARRASGFVRGARV